MKEIKVYIQYPWRISDSQYYKNMLDYPPEGIKYSQKLKKVGMITNKKSLNFENKLKSFLRRIPKKFNLNIPNVKKTMSNKNYDLIHCAHCLSLNNSPWVADFESLWQIWVSGKPKKKGKKIILKLLQKESCKKIIAWTEYTKREIVQAFPEIKHKVTVIPFALPPKKKKKKIDKKIKLFFVGRYFRKKGGLHTLRVFDILTKKYPHVEGIFVSQVPPKIKKQYSKNKQLKIYDLIPYKKIMEDLFPSSDIYIYPGYSDTFGFTFIEALSFGLPIITVEGHARKDIITPGKTGFIVNRPINLNADKLGKSEEQVIQQIVKYASELIENKQLLQKMSQNCYNEVENGKFSLNEKNKKLLKIYKEALN